MLKIVKHKHVKGDAVPPNFFGESAMLLKSCVVREERRVEENLREWDKSKQHRYELQEYIGLGRHVQHIYISDLAYGHQLYMLAWQVGHMSWLD